MHSLYFDLVVIFWIKYNSAGASLYLIQNITTRPKYNSCNVLFTIEYCPTWLLVSQILSVLWEFQIINFNIKRVQKEGLTNITKRSNSIRVAGPTALTTHVYTNHKILFFLRKLFFWPQLPWRCRPLNVIC